MGTRGLMGIRIDGQDKAAYNHFDSYPEALGAAMLADVGRLGLIRLTALAGALRVVQQDIPPAPDEIDRLKIHARNVASGDLSDWYVLTRDLQGELAKTLEAGVILDGSDFIFDSLYCEWGYIVNLDEETFEVYRGFQKEPHSKGRYASGTPRDGYGGPYYPCALIATFPLWNVPADWIQQIAEDDDDD